MNRGRVLSFIVGFLCGGVALLAALATTPVVWSWGPGMAQAAPAAQKFPSAKEIAEAVVREFENRVTPSGDAKENSLQCDLQTVRSQIQLYKVQHWDKPPGLDAQGRFDAQLFAAQLTSRTDSQGNVCPAQGDSNTHSLGPYLQRMPANPFLADPVAGRVIGGRGEAPRNGKSGWWMDTDSCMFSANHPERSGS